jgi:hypothetical protein
MMKFRLSPAFLMAVLAIAAMIPLTFGVTPQAIGGAVFLVGFATTLVKRGASRYTGWNAQMGKIGEADIEAQYKETQANLKDIGDQLKAHAETAQKHVDRHEGLSKETSAKVDELLMKQGELQARVLEAEQKLVNANRDTVCCQRTNGRRQLVVPRFSSRFCAARCNYHHLRRWPRCYRAPGHCCPAGCAPSNYPRPGRTWSDRSWFA